MNKIHKACEATKLFFAKILTMAMLHFLIITHINRIKNKHEEELLYSWKMFRDRIDADDRSPEIRYDKMQMNLWSINRKKEKIKQLIIDVKSCKSRKEFNKCLDHFNETFNKEQA